MKMVKGGYGESNFLPKIPGLLITLFLSITGFSQSAGPLIDFPDEDIPISECFSKIERATRLFIVVKCHGLKPDEKVHIPARQMTYEQVLKVVLHPRRLFYEKKGKTIWIDEDKTLSPEFPRASAGSQIFYYFLPARATDRAGDPLANAVFQVPTTGDYFCTNPDGTAHCKFRKLPEMVICFAADHEPDTVIVQASDKSIRANLRKKEMDAIVITGYIITGNYKAERSNTGDHSIVDQAGIPRQIAANALEPMSGRVSGLLMTATSGISGAVAINSLRGRNSVLGGWDPLIVINGVPVGPANFSVSRISTGSASRSLSPYSMIDVNDIEKYEVLKDADATAIYGTRGANGVILITTRQAHAGKHFLDISYSTGRTWVTRRPAMMNTQQYVAMRREALTNDGIPIDSLKAPDITRLDTTKTTDWGKYLIGHPGQIARTRISSAGGSARNYYYLTYSLMRETQPFPTHPDHTLHSLSGNFHHRSTDNHFNLQGNLTLGFDRNNQFLTDITRFQVLAPTLSSLWDAPGKMSWNKNGISFANPYSFIDQPYAAGSIDLLANMTAIWQTGKYTRLSLNTGLSSLDIHEQSLIPLSAQDTTGHPQAQSHLANAHFISMIVEPQFEYHRKWGHVNTSLTTGATWQPQQSGYSTIDAFGFKSDGLLNNPYAGDSISSAGRSGKYVYQALFTRLNIKYDEQWVLNATGRRDGSTRFGPDRQWGNFGSIGVAWVFSEQSRIRKKASFLSLGKIRASYGITGNDQIGAGVRYLDVWTPSAIPYSQNSAGDASPGPVNPNLTWEGIKKFELALDLSLIHNRIQLSTCWYRNRSTNQWLPDSFPNAAQAIHFSNKSVILQNTGWEGCVTASIVSDPDFEWSSTFNISFPVNKLVSFPGLSSFIGASSSGLETGRSLTNLKGLRYTGVNPLTGVFTFNDKNGDGKYTTEDLYHIGNLDPVCFGGWENRFRCGPIQLSALLAGRIQQAINYQAAFYANNPPGAATTTLYNNETVDLLDRWRQPGNTSAFQKLTTKPLSAPGRQIGNFLGSNAMLTNGSFVRLKSVIVSFALPARFLQKLKLIDAHLSVTGENLFTITQYKDVDPEIQNIQILPPMKTLSIGFQARI